MQEVCLVNAMIWCKMVRISLMLLTELLVWQRIVWYNKEGWFAAEYNDYKSITVYGIIYIHYLNYLHLKG